MSENTNQVTVSEGQKNRRYQIIVGWIGAAGVVAAALIPIFIGRCANHGGRKDPATETRITGRVANAVTDEPIRKAQVSIEAAGVPESSETDSRGIFSVRLPGEYINVRVRVVARGFKPYDQLLPRDRANELVAINLEPERRSSQTDSSRPPAGWQNAGGSSAASPAKTTVLNTSLPVIAGDGGPWAVIVFGEQERRDDVTSAVRAVLSESGRDTVSLFRKVADEQRMAPEIFGGGSDLLRGLQVGRFCSGILAGKLSVSRVGATEGITIARATLKVHVVSPAGEVLKQFELSEKGGGEDDSSARRRAVDELLGALPRELPGRVN